MQKYRVAVLVLVVASGLLLRLWGLNFGLPYRYHVDETQIVPPAARLCAGDYHMPYNYAGPNLQHVVLCAGDLALYTTGVMVGSWHSPREFAQAYEITPTSVFLIARVIHALLGTMTLVIVYWLGRALWNEKVGLVAAVILSFTYLHVRESHFASRDLFVSALLAVSFFFAARLLRTRSLWDEALSGLFSGFAAGVMWTTGLGFLPTVTAHFFAFRNASDGPGLQSRTSLRMFSVAVVAVVTGFLFAYPNLLLRPAVALEYFNYLINRSSEQEFGFLFDSSPGWFYYLKTLWWGAGPLLLLVFLGGTVLAAYKHSPQDMLLLAFMIPYFVVIAGTSNYIGRYLMPLIPIAVVLGAKLLVLVSEQLSQRLSQQRRILVGLTLLAVTPSLVSSLRFDYLLTQIDTRTLAKVWIEQHIPDHTKIAVDWSVHGPPLATLTEPQPNSAKVYEVIIMGDVGLARRDLAYYRKQGVQLLVTSSNIENVQLRDPELNSTRQAFYQSLGDNLRLLAEFKPYADEMNPPFVFDEIYAPAASLWKLNRSGPTLRIYALTNQQ